MIPINEFLDIAGISPIPAPGCELRARAKISSQSWRSDLGEIWPIRLRKGTGIAGCFEGFGIVDTLPTFFTRIAFSLDLVLFLMV